MGRERRQIGLQIAGAVAGAAGAVADGGPGAAGPGADGGPGAGAAAPVPPQGNVHCLYCNSLITGDESYLKTHVDRCKNEYQAKIAKEKSKKNERELRRRAEQSHRDKAQTKTGSDATAKNKRAEAAKRSRK